MFDPDEDGTQIESKRFMLKDAQYRTKSMLGLGLINWRTHVKAIQIKALLDYRNATRSDYKKILNEWIEPNWGSDDMIFYNVKNKANSLRLGNSRAPLPKFWKEAFNVPLRTRRQTLADSLEACVNSGECPEIHVKRW